MRSGPTWVAAAAGEVVRAAAPHATSPANLALGPMRRRVRSPDGRCGRCPEDDWIVIGSGFGGSVSALRLAQEGHRVALPERAMTFVAAA